METEGQDVLLKLAADISGRLIISSSLKLMDSRVWENGKSFYIRGRYFCRTLRYGIQPGFGFKTKYFSAAISTRIVSLNYSNIKGNLVYNGENQIAYLNDNKSNFLLEPALTVRGGLEK